MTSVATHYLPARQLADLVGGGAHGLTPRVEWAEDRRPFRIRDSFDQRLRLSRRILLESNGRMELLSDAGAIPSQNAGPATRAVARPEPRFVADFADGPVKAALADLSPLRALLPVVSGSLRSGRLAWIDDEGKTRVRAALHMLEPANGADMVLVTAQGLRGYDDDLHDFVAHIRRCGGKPLDAGNLYRKLDPAYVDYTPRPKIVVGGTETAFDAATDLIDGHLPVARANEAGIVADLDTEFLHDYRIALRKIRSVLSLFKGVYDAEQTIELKARFSALMAPTGPLRDLDVYLLEQQSFFDLVPDSIHGGLEAMFALLADRRAREQAALARHLRGKAYEKEIRALAKLFAKRRNLLPGPNAERTSHDLACELIWKRYRRIGRIAASLTVSTPDAEVHALRIECKKLRYLMEFFGPVFPKTEFRSLLKPLKRLQDSLGLFNDYAVQQDGLQAFADTLGDTPRGLEIARSIGALVVVLHQRQVGERKKILAAFADFNGNRTQRTFRQLFHAGKEG